MTPTRLVSVNVGKPRQVTWKGRTVTTGIFKEPVAGPVTLRQHNLEGDAQADLSVHGGLFKAVYLYASEHYAAWHRELPDSELPQGIFGENFTTEGILEEDMHIGDRLRIGTAIVRVSQPRMPCYKLGLQFGCYDMVKRFLESRRTRSVRRGGAGGRRGSGREFRPSQPGRSWGDDRRFPASLRLRKGRF